MQTEVFNNIDTLIEMSGLSSNAEEINTELITLKRQIKNKNNEIEDLKSIMTDTRYFNASNELVDKNIEISLKNKISRLNRKLKNIENELEEINISEIKLHTEIKELKNKLDDNKKYVTVLEEKATNSTSNDYFKNLLKQEKDNVEALTKTLDEKTEEHQKVLKELDLTNLAIEELKNKVTNEESRLNDILDSLNNPNAYIDEDLKANDEEKLKSLENELESLEKRELELLTDANIIGLDAKELIARQDIENGLSKVKELVTIVKSKPYMDITSQGILDEELEKKESLRIELSNLIDSKTYKSANIEAIKERITYITNDITKNNEEVAKIENEINKIDEFVNNEIGSKITSLEQEINKSNRSLKEYRAMLKNSNSLKTRTNIENAISKKEKENDVLDKILLSYKENLLDKIKESNTLSEKIVEIKSKNNNYETELEELQKVNLVNFHTKDLIEEEKDKEELKKLNEEISLLKERRKYDKSPNEIYDQIEMLLATVKPISKPKEEISSKLDIDSLFDSTPEIKEENTSTNTRLKVIEMIPVETVKKTSGGNI